MQVEITTTIEVFVWMFMGQTEGLRLTIKCCHCYGSIDIDVNALQKLAFYTFKHIITVTAVC